MDERQERTTDGPPDEMREIGSVLAAWPDLAPHPEAMNQVTALMVSGLASAQAAQAEPGESQFRLLTIVWAVVVLGGYLAWDFLSGWFSLHPVWTAVMIAVALLSLLAPLLLVPVLHVVDRSVAHDGGASPC